MDDKPVDWDNFLDGLAVIVMYAIGAWLTFWLLLAVGRFMYNLVF